jgi:hypothetical protein
MAKAIARLSKNPPLKRAKSFSETGIPSALIVFPYQVKQAHMGFEGLYPRQAVFDVSLKSKKPLAARTKKK